MPFLGDIPLLGLLFKHTVDVEEKHNLVVMLSPTILDDTAPTTGYEAMGWQSIEDFEPLPLSSGKSSTNAITPEKAAPTKDEGKAEKPYEEPSDEPSSDAPAEAASDVSEE